MGHSSFQSHLRYTGLVGEDLRKDMNKHPFNNPKTRKQLEERFAKLVSSEKQEVKQN